MKLEANKEYVLRFLISERVYTYRATILEDTETEVKFIEERTVGQKIWTFNKKFLVNCEEVI